jgi:hypothetical protein
MEQISNGTDFEFWTVLGFIQIFEFEQVSNFNSFKLEQILKGTVSNLNRF